MLYPLSYERRVQSRVLGHERTTLRRARRILAWLAMDSRKLSAAAVKRAGERIPRHSDQRAMPAPPAEPESRIISVRATVSGPIASNSAVARFHISPLRDRSGRWFCATAVRERDEMA